MVPVTQQPSYYLGELHKRPFSSEAVLRERDGQHRRLLRPGRRGKARLGPRASPAPRERRGRRGSRSGSVRSQTAPPPPSVSLARLLRAAAGSSIPKNPKPGFGTPLRCRATARCQRHGKRRLKAKPGTPASSRPTSSARRRRRQSNEQARGGPRAAARARRRVRTGNLLITNQVLSQVELGGRGGDGG